MAIKKGICKNVFNCTKADANEMQEVDEFQDFICSECHQPLVETGANGKKGKDAPKGSPVKKILAIGVPVLIVAGGAVYFFLQGDTKVESIRLNQASQEIFVGETDTLLVDHTPLKAKVNYRWSSDNEAIAQVDDKGVVTMVGEGNAIITVKALENEEAVATCSYKVKKVEIEEEIVEEESEANVDSIPLKKAAEEGEEIQSASTNINLGYATYEGPQQNGKPHGIGGKLTFKAKHSIDLKKMPAEYLEVQAGEYIENTKFDNGRLIQGELHRKDGTRKWIHI